MAVRRAVDIAELLGQLKLVDPADLSRALEAAESNSVEDYLKVLQRRELITNYQANLLQKGETRGLRLGKYKLQYLISAGSFARVFRGCRIDDPQQVAIKVLRERWSNDEDMVALFRREGELGRRLNHENTVPTREVNSEDGQHYIVLDFVEGGNLRDFIKIRGKLTPLEAARYTRDIAKALEYALKLGMTHRDMKTTNVLMSSQGTAKLIDFGLAAEESPFRGDGPEVLNALEYSTLEKNTGAPPNDPRSDLFFLGTIAYEMLVGAPPYPRTSNREERKRIGRYRDIRPITSVDPTLPGPVVTVVEKLLRLNPVERYQSATEVVHALSQVIVQLGGEAPAAGTASKDGENGPLATILCVESRHKHQNLLRKHLTKWNVRVLMLSDFDRALSRLNNSPPDCLLIMAESMDEDRIVPGFREVVTHCRTKSLAAVIILGADQSEAADELRTDLPQVKVLMQPVKLGNLRREVQAALNAR